MQASGTCMHTRLPAGAPACGCSQWEARRHERRRLAAELHDGVAQQLVVTRLALQGLLAEAAASAPAPASQRRLHQGVQRSVQRLEEALQALHRLSVDLHGPPPLALHATPARLTPRERTLLQWLAQGAGNRRIAEALGLSVRTVEAHRLHLRRKLHLGSPGELVKFAVEHVLPADEAPAQPPEQAGKHPLPLVQGAARLHR